MESHVLGALTVDTDVENKTEGVVIRLFFVIVQSDTTETAATPELQ